MHDPFSIKWVLSVEKDKLMHVSARLSELCVNAL